MVTNLDPVDEHGTIATGDNLEPFLSIPQGKTFLFVETKLF